MKLFKKLVSFTWTYKFFNTWSNLIQYVKDYDLVSDTLYSHEFKLVLKKYLYTDFEKDWLGRLYGVINPNIDVDGKINFSNVIFEIDGDNTNSNEYLKSWVYNEMKLIGDLFKIEKLYDYISINFQHVGPVEHDNYLVVFDITSRIDFIESLKSFLKHTILYLIVIGAVLWWIA